MSLMSSNFQELGLEAIDTGVDKYYDWAHDGVGRSYSKMKGKISRRKSNSKRDRDRKDVDQRGASEPAGAHDQNQAKGRGDDDYYDDRDYRDRDGRSGRGRRDYSPYSDEERGYRPPPPPNPYGQPPPPPMSPSQQYNPSRYVPPGYAPAAGGAAAGVAAAALPPPPGQQQFLPPPQAYDDGYDSYDSDYDRRHRPRKSKSTNDMKRYSDDDDEDGGGDDNQSRGSEGGKKNRKQDIAVTVAGALAGGLLGHEISSRRGKPESFNMIAGAVIGAVGAHEANKFYDGRKGQIREKLRQETDKLKGRKRSKSRGSRDRYRNDDDDRY